jgi:hypothetical protein
VFTTNFDPLIEESAISANALESEVEQVRPTVAAIDSAGRALRCLNESDWPLVAKLHGDYQSIAIKNTNSELQQQDVRMRHVLIEASKRFGMVFVGYSGRDESVMEALNSVLRETTPFPNGLYWITPSASKLLPAVKNFLDSAVLAGVDVAIVECKTFDELAAELIKHIDLPQVLIDHVLQARATPRLVPVNLPDIEAVQFPVLRYSALLIESLPRFARRMTLTQTTNSRAIRELLKERRCKAVVALHRRELAVFGKDDEVLAALAPLGAQIAGTVELNAANDSWALGLIYDALVRALSRNRPLIPRMKRMGHSLIVAAPREGDHQEKTLKRDQILAQLRIAYGNTLTGSVPKLDFPFYEGIFLKLEEIEGRWWCGFEPYTFVDTPKLEYPEDGSQERNGKELDALNLALDHRGNDPAGDWRRERWAQKYNKQWAAIIDAWAMLLTNTMDGKLCAFGLDDEMGIDATFAISRFTAWSRPGHHHKYFDRIK